jgi:hypothetical protein
MSLKEILGQIKGLPGPVKILILLLVGTSAAGGARMVDPRLGKIYLIGFVAIIALYAVYKLIADKIKKKQAAGFGAQLNSTNAQAPSGINDPAKRARLDDLRKNFEKGIGRYRTAGKDIYSLPWLLVVGEPGSGKTEAIRHSSVGFPPGLQDELQGVGGTINMNWWFTNRGVVLDTAGRLMFEEVEAGATSEWREFLGLLRKARGNCPINGMLLAIPVDTLIKDTTDQIAKKAARIAQQLDVIQRTLDVRFPVFVVITKCDLLNGFREFFDNLTDPQLQHQILGWSNPAPLDEPFRPELVGEHLKHVADSLSKRRTGLLRDPVPESAGGRRTDEVDALYALPTSINALAPRLRRYLEAIFAAGEWSAKPLFMRGIYFSSAMREGSALDLELAEAIGVSVESLPEGKAWERERAYFLRDLFLEKVFVEKGLVTRASNTRQLVRRRQFVTLATLTAGLLAVIGLSILGYHSLYASVGTESAIWQTAAEGWIGNEWDHNQIVTPDFKGSTSYSYNGAQTVKVGGRTMTLAEFHNKLAALTKENIRVPGIFLPLEKVVASLNPGRRRAQSVLFEASVLRPLVEAARTKITSEKGPWTPEASRALAVLLRLEGLLRNPDVPLTGDDVSVDTFLLPLTQYVAPKAGDAPRDLGIAFDAGFVTNLSRNRKSLQWLSAGGSLLENPAVATGLNRFFAQAQADRAAQDKGFDKVRDIRRELRAYRDDEEELERVADEPVEPPQMAHDALPVAARISDARGSVAAAVEALVSTGQADKTFPSLTASYKGMADRARASTETAFKVLQAEINRFPAPAGADPEKTGGYALPEQVNRLLRSNLQDLRDRVDTTLTSKEEQELQELDDLYMVRAKDGSRLYEIRSALYQRAVDPLPASSDDAVSLVGRLGRVRETLDTNERQLAERTKAFEGKDASRVQLTIKSLVPAGQYHALEALLTRYAAQVHGLLSKDAAFPLAVSEDNGLGATLKVDAAKALQGQLHSVAKDLAAAPTASWPVTLGPKVDDLAHKVAAPTQILDAILPVSGSGTVSVAVALAGTPDQKTLMAERLNSEEFGPNAVSFFWRTMRIGGARVSTESPTTIEVARIPLAASGFSVDFFRGVDDAKADASVAFSGDWAVLRLLHQGYTHRREGGKDWEVMLPLKDGAGHERHLFLILKFDRPLPEMADWPTRAQLTAAP